MGIAAAVTSFVAGAGAAATTAAVVGTIVEGAIIGSVVSGGIAAVTGGDVGDAMLTGAITGGIAGPISGAIGAVAPQAAAVGSMTNAVATGAVIGAGTAIAEGTDIVTGTLLGGAGAGLGKLASNTLDDILGTTTGSMTGGGTMTPAQDLAVQTTSEFTDATSQSILGSPLLQQGTNLAGMNATDDLIQQAIANGGTLPSTVILAPAPMPTADIRPMVPGTGIDVEDLKTGIAGGSPAITGTTPVEPLQNAGDVLRAAQGGVDEVIDAAIPPANTVTGANQAFAPTPEPVQTAVNQANAGVTTNPNGTTTQTFSDGSTLTTNAAGEVLDVTPPAATTPTTSNLAGFVDDSGTLYDEFGNPSKNLSGGYVDKSGMVYDEFGNPAGKLNAANNTNVDFSGVLNSNGTITRLDGSNTVIDTSGKVVSSPSGVSSGVIGGAAGGATTIPLQQQPQQQGFGESSYTWGEVPQIVQPGLNPGVYAKYVKPMYPEAAPGQSQYYWGAQQYAPTENEARFYNMGTNAPTQPFGAAKSAVGGTDTLDINAYINQFMTPQRQQAVQGSQPQFAGSTGTNPLVTPAPVAQQPVTIQPTVLPIAPQVIEQPIPVVDQTAQQVLEPVAP